MFRNFFLALVMLMMTLSMYAMPTKIEGRIRGAGSIKETYLYPDKAFGSFKKQVIPYLEQPTFAAAIADHTRMLKKLGRQDYVPSI